MADHSLSAGIPAVKSEAAAAAPAVTPTPIPTNWATLTQSAPRNIADAPAVDNLIVAGRAQIGEVVGSFLARGAIARVAIGVERYGSALSRDNGRDHCVDALQEIADAVVYLAAEHDELTHHHDGSEAAYARLDWIERALSALNLAAACIRASRVGTNREVPQ